LIAVNSQAVKSGLQLVHDLLDLSAVEAVGGKSEEDMTSSDELDGEHTVISSQQEKARAMLRSIMEQYKEGVLYVLSPPQAQAKPLSQEQSSQHALSQSMRGEEVECLRLLDMCVNWYVMQ